MVAQIGKKWKFVADGMFFAELNEVLTRELAEDGFSGVEVRVTPVKTEIIFLLLGHRTFLFMSAGLAVVFFGLSSWRVEKGCEVIVSGRLRAQHAKSIEFKDVYMVSSGQPVKEYIDSAVSHLLLRQVGLVSRSTSCLTGIHPKGKQRPTKPIPELVTIHPPKEV